MKLVVGSPEQEYLNREDVLIFALWCIRLDLLDEPKLPENFAENALGEVYTSYSAYKEVERLCGEFLPRLANCLNRYHNLKWHLEAWRVVIGPWLYSYMSNIFYLHGILKATIDKYPGLSVHFGQYLFDIKPPADLSEADRQFSCPLYLTTKVREMWTAAGYRNSVVDDGPRLVSGIEHLRTDRGKRIILAHCLRHFGVSLFNKFYKLLSDRSDYLLIRTFTPWKRLLKIGYFLRTLPNPRLYGASTLASSDLGAKSSDGLLDCSPINCEDELVKYISGDIYKSIPLAYTSKLRFYLEGTRQIFPRAPKVVVTANSYHYDEGFKIWLANQMTTNRPMLAIVQHGGYGTSKWSATLAHQLRICDSFISWGWKGSSKKITALGSQKLREMKKGIQRSRCRSYILFVLDSDIINYLILNFPNGSPFGRMGHILGILMLISAQAQATHSAIRLRLYHTDFGRYTYGLSQFVNRFYRNIPVDQNKSFESSVAESRLVVVTYWPNVSFYEAVVSGAPAIVYLAQGESYFSEEMEELLPELLDCGILHFEERTVKKHISMSSRDLERWWTSQLTQVAVNRFLSKFGRVSKEFPMTFASHLKSLMNSRE